jgi:hypothetical protein
MLKPYMAKNGIIANSDNNKTIAIVGITIFNDENYEITATINLLNSSNDIESKLLETKIASKETLFLDTKIFLSNGYKLFVNGAYFTLAGNEDVV